MKSLVVEDEFVALTKMITLLRKYGTSDAATHGEQAIQMFVRAFLDGSPYDLVALDIELPGMTGLDVLEELRQKEKVKQIPPAKKVMMTASPSRDYVQQALNNRCDGFLVKPVTAEALAKLMSRLGFKPAEPAPAEVQARQQGPVKPDRAVAQTKVS